MRFVSIAVAFVLAIPISFPARAHGGGLNAEGCHNNRKTGDYHCHQSGAPTPQRQNRPVQSARGGSYFANCASARAAGAAPLRRGDSGYRAGLDRDNDGIACE